MTTPGDVTRRWRLSQVGTAPLRESRSAASVTPVEAPHGRAFLKVTTPAAGASSMAEARRELAFYIDVAPRVPHAVPRLLEAYDGDDGLALLVEDVGRVLPANAWDTPQWTRLAETVREVHAVRPDRRPEFSHTVPLDEALAGRSDDVVRFWDGLTPPLEDVLGTVSRYVPPLLGGDAFVHGDLHLDNILVTDDVDGVRVADWQQCGFGSAAADLAFINVRLAPSARTVPETFLPAYAAAGGDDLGALRRAVALIELATYLLVWPPFAAYNGAEGVAAVRARTADLATWATTEGAL